MNRILIATTNPGKIKEFKTLLKNLPAELLNPKDLGIDILVEEDGADYVENARKKAGAYCQASGLMTIADDSGLEVDVLHGAPGLHSARFSPLPGATDEDRRSYLLEKLKPYPQPWNARFFCSLALAFADETQYTFQGICYGKIINQERGQNGFGYDPIFELSGCGQTMAELSDADKNEVSHRGRAVKAALPTIKRILKESAGQIS